MRSKLLLIASAIVCVFTLNTMHASTCQPVSANYLTSGLGDMTTDGVWTWDSYNYAKARHQGGGEDNLFTPALDLSGTDGVTIAFSHTHRYANEPSADYTLWVTDDYKGSYAASTWKQLTISPYATNNDWNFVNVSIDVPVSYVGAKTVFCFKYTSTAEKNGTWEVKNLRITGTCEGVSAPPVALPNIGDGRLKVCAQNLLNYYYNYNTGRGNYTPAEFADKTRKITDAILWTDADVYGFCELEAQDIILKQLVDSLNKVTKSTQYSYVADEINEAWNETYDNNLKSGFIYRNTKVKTIGSSVPAYSANYYRNTMRVQTFEELSSGERFTLSMNHFKSKAGNAEDQGNSTRVTNATRLIENLPSNALDKDILIVGDLNCEVGEDPLDIIEAAGYTEQLLKYDASAYSHCYNGGELIDHVYANASMAAQITGAGVFHISTSCGADASANYGHRYSDHDPYLVGINLVSSSSGECEEVEDSYLPTGGSSLGDMKAVSVSGQYYWRYQSSYGATCADMGGEDWLLTPAYDLSKAGAVTLEFDHTIGYAHDMPTEQTLWVTSNFSDVAGSSWTQLTIPTYPSGKNWTFVNTKVNVPLSIVGKNTVFGFKYAVPAIEADKSPTWEIKNLQVKVTCDDVHSALENNPCRSVGMKMIRDGQLIIILPDGTRYNAIGVRMQ
ncbi:MAG: choice-of-anchor J domain-containing protein [Paludibacteraceae bacterium]|nr:choice-of-anchor J domain-containing protein [Paludibacteraceae bacterium]